MTEDIDYKALYEQVIGENERLRERVTNFALQKHISFEKIVAAWQNMEWQSRYFAVVITCAILLAVSRIIRDVRGV
jgi:hypothetical protein